MLVVIQFDPESVPPDGQEYPVKVAVDVDVPMQLVPDSVVPLGQTYVISW